MIAYKHVVYNGQFSIHNKKIKFSETLETNRYGNQTMYIVRKIRYWI